MSIKLWSPNGNMDDKSTHIALSSGHTFIVPHDRAGIEVPTRFRREAIARGCIPVGDEPESEEAAGFDRDAVIREKLKFMLEADDTSMFTSDGKPVLDKLSQLCGFALSRSEVNRVWDAMMQDDDGGGVETVSVTPAKKGKG